MKRIIVAGAIMLAAVASQAASVTWSVVNIQSSPNTTVGAGWLVQIYAAGTEFSYDAAKAGTITALDSSTSFASGTIFRAQGTFGNYSASDPVNTFAVIFDASTVADAKNYVVSADLNKSIAASGANLTIAFGNMGSTATTNMFRNASWTAAAVPEPTSGLLILLGMAGLALRRRRA